jgi:hypothetical protein
MSDVEVAVRGCQQIEAILKSEFSATGKGLHELVTDVQGQLPHEVVRRIRRIATIRNQVVHEGAALDDKNDFAGTVQALVRELKDLSARTDRSPVTSVADASNRVSVPRSSVLWAILLGVLSVFALLLVHLSRTSDRVATLESENRRPKDRLVEEWPSKQREASPVTTMHAQPGANPTSHDRATDDGENARYLGNLREKAAQSRDSYLLAQEDLDSGVFGFLISNTKVVLDEPSLRPNDDGTFDILVPVRWDVDSAGRVLDTLNKYFRDDSRRLYVRGFMIDGGSGNRRIEIPAQANMGDVRRLAYSDKLMLHLLQKEVRIVVNVGDRTSSLTIASGTGRSRNSLGSFRILLNNSVYFNESLGDPKKERNPIVFSKLSESDLESMHSMQHAVVVVDATSPRS